MQCFLTASCLLWQSILHYQARSHVVETLNITSNEEKQVIDITDIIYENFLQDHPNANSGLLHIYPLHTSAAVTVTDFEPGTEEDLLTAFDKMVPAIEFHHQSDPSHMPSHVITALMKPALLVPVRAGKIVLGMWQRIVLVELSGPGEREVVMTYVPSESAVIKHLE